MNIITLDFETHFSDDYTLKKMTTEAYIRDPRFEVLGCSIKWIDSEENGGAASQAWWYEGEELHDTLRHRDWSQWAVLCHHSHFDGLILSHHYGIEPAFWYDTLSMARLLLGNHLSVGLDSLAKHFGLQAKTVPYDLFRGKHWHELSPSAQQQVGEGACHDVELTWSIFQKLGPLFPAEEFALVDATVRMFTEPVLEGDTQRLGAIWTIEAEEKRKLLADLGVTGADLRSNEKFAELLRAQGVEPERKPGKNGDIYAFASTDDHMRDLQEDLDPTVVALAEARLSEKSNIVQSRSCRLGWMSTRGAMPVYLSYCAAHTTRWGGGDKVNWQNFPRESALGGAIRAPEGHMVVVNDASQIECRILNMVAGQHDVIERFRDHQDPYTSIASQFYGFPVTKANPKERGTGKQLELSCGYGAGGPTIRATAKRGTYGPPVYLDAEQAMRARDLYRGTHPSVVSLWQSANEVLKKLSAGITFDWHCLHVKDKRIYLPNGAPLIYETLEWHTDHEHMQDMDRAGVIRAQEYWRIKTRRGYAKLYGAKLVENVIQALARLHVSQAWLRCAAAGIRMVSMEHDKLIAVVREHEADAALVFMQSEMSRAPDWLPGIPLDSEGYVSHTFAKEIKA